MNDYLFASSDLRSTIDNVRRNLAKQIGSLPPGQLLAADIDQICKHFVGEFTLDPIEIQRDAVELIDPVEVEVEVHGDFGRTIRRKVLEFRFEVPFSGDAYLFKLQASTFDSNPPRGEVVGDRLIFIHRRADRDAEGVKREIHGFLSAVAQNIEWQRAQIDPWNSALPEAVRQDVAARREKLMADKQLVDGLGFKIRRRDEAPKAIAAPVRRKLVVPLLPEKAGPLAKPEPMLEMSTYEEILDTLAGMSVVMERNPSAFLAIDEESLRTHFLIPLNSNFQGQASGETFNAAGKTDILIKYEDRILFVAECKFWKGAQSLLDAITQLMSYLTWRETKAAILLFNRNRNFSSVLEQIPSVIKQHPLFVRNESYDRSTSFRFVVRSTADANRYVLVTLLAFDVPSGA